MRFLFQLKIASDCGITIPTTLCSNDLEEIRLFFRQNEAHGITYKPLNGEDKPIKINRMNCITQQLPGIFQKESIKHYELRVTCFGNYLVAVKLNSPSNQQHMTEFHTLPDDLAIKIRAFMRELRVAFGTCDFIVTPDHDYIFLNVNEQIHYRCSTL